MLTCRLFTTILFGSLASSLAFASAEIEALRVTNAGVQQIYSLLTVIESGLPSENADINSIAQEIKANCKIEMADVAKSGTPQAVSIRTENEDTPCGMNYTFSAVDFDLKGDRVLNTQLTITSIPVLRKLGTQVFSYAQNYRMRAPEEGLSEGEMTFTALSMGDLSISGTSVYKNVKANTENTYSVVIENKTPKTVQLTLNEVLGEDSLTAIESRSVYKLNGRVITQAEAFSLSLK
jgi:hypothetical protein